MRNKIILLWLAILPASVFATDPPIDPKAVQILDAMSSIIGDFNSVSYELHATWDESDKNSELVQQSGASHVYMVGPDKMLIDSRWTHKDHRGFWYNGTRVVYYNYDENNYALIDAPPTIVKAIYQVNRDFGVKFPGADFFFSTFTDDLINNSDQIKYLGKEMINGKECFHIIAVNKKLNIQIWISNDSFNLPVKFVIIFKELSGNPQYEASFSNWNINPGLPDAMFEFVPPPNSIEVKIIPRKSVN